MTNLGPPPRPAPRRADSVAIVDAVVQAARDLMSTGEEFTNDQLAERAGVGRTSMLRYFPTRPAVYTEVLRREHQRLAEAARSALVAGVSIEDALRGSVDAFLPRDGGEVHLRRQLQAAIPLAWTLHEFEHALSSVQDFITVWLGSHYPDVPPPVLRRRVFLGLAAARGAAGMLFYDQQAMRERDQIVDELSALLVELARGRI